MVKRKLFFFFLGLLLFFIAWECGVRVYTDHLFVLPAPSEIFKTLVEMRGRFWLHTSFTLKEMCLGFCLALLFAFPLAWTMLRYKTSRSFLQPLFILIQSIPMFALAPIMVIWFGWSTIAIVIPTALMILFPLTLNIYQGLRSTPEELLEFFRSNQATSWQIFCKLRLPSAIPHIFAGFRISAAIAGVSAVAGEWAGAQQGLGILMLESRRNTDLEVTFAALFCLTFISIVLYGIILYCEKIALPPRRWNLRAMALIFLSLLFCSGCQKKETQTRLLLDWLPNPNHVPLYVALEKGYFKEENLDISIQKMAESCSGIPYLVSKQADLLISYLPSTLKACAKGAKLKMVGMLIKEPLCGLTYRADLAIQKPSDLSGKVLGYCLDAPDTELLNLLLKNGNIEPSEKTNVSMDLIAAMLTRKVDFIYGGFWNIESPQLHSLGMKTKTIKIQELDIPNYYEMIILAHADSAQASSDFIIPFQRALQKSLDFCKEFPEEAFGCFIKHNPDERVKTITWQKEAWNLTFPLLAKDQSVDTELVETFYQWQLSQEIIDKPFDFQSLITFQ